jgi:hypothetical protein
MFGILEILLHAAEQKENDQKREICPSRESSIGEKKTDSLLLPEGTNIMMPLCPKGPDGITNS